MANGLLSRGHQVRILFGRGRSDQLVKIFRVIKNRLLYGSFDWVEMFQGCALCYNDIKECEFADDEIIIASGIECSAQLDLLKADNNVKLQYIRGLSPWQPEVTEKALSMKLPKIAISSSDAEKMRSYNSGKILAVIPNGINVQEYYPSVDEKDRNGIGTIYSGHPAKDPKTILAVLHRLRDAFPNVPQYLFGAYPRPKEIPRKSYVRLPSLSKAREIYSRSLIWFLGSCSEGFSLPILEAMACGCAVVATDCGGPRDIIVDGENGFLVEVGNVKQIVGRIKLLLDNPELRQRFVRKSRETVSKFSWDNSVNKLEEVLRSLVKSPTNLVMR
jgi:glycosyltransferase involved in cell wall biosynthesis